MLPLRQQENIIHCGDRVHVAQRDLVERTQVRHRAALAFWITPWSMDCTPDHEHRKAG